MSEQLSFRLPIKVARERDAFFVSEANQQAVAQLENTAIWPQGKLILLGPKACGKTHLLEIWATEQNAQKIDPFAGICAARGRGAGCGRQLRAGGRHFAC